MGIMTGKLVNDCVSSTGYVDKYIHDLMITRLYLKSIRLILGQCMKNFSAHVRRFKEKESTKNGL
jgi:hypothetical protein